MLSEIDFACAKMLGGWSYAVGAMLAISAIDNVEKVMPTITIKYIQMAPAVPPLESGASIPIVDKTHPFPSNNE